MRVGRTVAIYADTGGGKTTQIGELVKFIYKTEGLKGLLIAADLGGHETLRPHERVGILDVLSIGEKDDPFVWINEATSGKLIKKDTGLIAFDSGTSISEALLNAIVKDPGQIGQQKTQKFRVGAERDLVVGSNNESHYGLVQGFMLDQIWRSTWLIKQGIDVIWTFGLESTSSPRSSPTRSPSRTCSTTLRSRWGYSRTPGQSPRASCGRSSGSSRATRI